MSRVVFDFSGENFVVTGASSGMGRQVAIELAEAGANVLAMARNKARLQDLQAQFPNNISVASLDVCDSEKMENAIKDFVAMKGKLQGGVHAAGINNFTPLRTYDSDLAKQIMNTSFWAGVELVRIITKARYANKAMSAVLFSSVCAQSAEKGMFAYASAKAAINACVKSLAKEINAKGHRINSIMPGWVENSVMTSSVDDVIDQKFFKKNHLLGLAKPEDVTGMVLFLLSDRGSWITGSSIAVDGGYLA